jgi:hypothetical protein
MTPPVRNGEVQAGRLDPWLRQGENVSEVGALPKYVSAFRTLKRQFESAAETYPLLSCLLISKPEADRHNSRTPYPVPGCHRVEDALSTDFAGGMFHGRSRRNEPRSRALSIHLWPAHPCYRHEMRLMFISRPDATYTQRHVYQTGRDYFVQLSRCAAQCLYELPASFLNDIVPAELTEFRDQQLAQQWMKLKQGSSLERPELEPDDQGGYDALLPPGYSDEARWIGLLYWLAWEGSLSFPGATHRQTWFIDDKNILTHPWFQSREEFNQYIDRFPSTRPDLNDTFEGSRHYFSVIENVFLCSALSIDDIESSIRHASAVTVHKQPSFRAIAHLYRAIVKAGSRLPHGKRNKRKDLAQDFREKILKLEPGVDPERFVTRAFAWCDKHPIENRARASSTAHRPRNGPVSRRGSLDTR